MSRTRARTTSFAVGAALAVLAATASTLPANAAVPPQPSGLTADSPPDNLTTTVLSWDRDTGATSYTVQVDDDPAFASPEYNQTTINVTAVPTLR